MKKLKLSIPERIPENMIVGTPTWCKEQDAETLRQYDEYIASEAEGIRKMVDDDVLKHLMKVRWDE